MDKEIKEKVAQELFGLSYEELCDPDKKHVRNNIKNNGGKFFTSPKEK